jgi:hypothetical protein
MAILKAVDMVTSPAAEEREELLAAAGRRANRCVRPFGSRNIIPESVGGKAIFKS